jgi:hypothetical protein
MTTPKIELTTTQKLDYFLNKEGIDKIIYEKYKN